MTKMQKKTISGVRRSALGRTAGFSLVELLVAMAIFLVIGAAAVRLVQSHVPLVSNQQNQAGMNMNLQNAIAQMQVDVVNAGAGYYNGASVADWPIGITILNCGNANTANVSSNGCSAAGSNCFNSTTFTYSASCFDTLNVLAMDTTTPAAHPTDSAGDLTGCNTFSNLADLYITPPTGVTAAALAAKYFTGDQVLLINVNTNGNEQAAGSSLANGNRMTTVVLTANGSVSGSLVHLQHFTTGTNGAYSTPGPPQDPLFISAIGTSDSSAQDVSSLTNTFCAQTDWALRLAPITYTVNTTNSADPQLTRNTSVIADQVIGFKVGAMTWNTNTTDDQSNYLFNAPGVYPGSGCTSTCGYQDNWPLIRSVMVSLIGRTPPNPSAAFKNSFDGGPYQVQALSSVINPRNLSMHDQ